MVMDDTFFMELAVKEARKGAGRTSPNPAVGAVIVVGTKIVGKGYHKKAGTPHAEVNAISAAQGETKGATIYVTLEPCNHTGRTPPCTQAILDSKISRVVIGMLDPNPHVAGNGVERLRQNGVEVKVGVHEQQCRELNFPFIKHITTGYPWVSMKAGLSLDGRISYKQGSGGKITGTRSHQYVHGLRDNHDSILIGIGTALTDNPSLTTRIEGQKGKDPVRIVLDSALRLSENARLLCQESDAQTLIFCNEKASLSKQKQLERKGAEVCRVKRDSDNHLSLRDILDQLGKRSITSVLVEGGSRVHGAFMAQDLVDQLFLFYAPFFIGEQGTPVLQGYGVTSRDEGSMFCNLETIPMGRDILLTALRRDMGP